MSRARLARAAALVLLATILLIIVTAATVWAHGDAAWIMRDPRFLMRNGITHCCGPQDCERLPRGAVVLKAEGYLVLRTGQLFRREDSVRYDSIDGDYWSCQLQPDAPVHCLFTPSLGF